MFVMLAFFAALLIIMACADVLFSAIMYLVYRYDGGHRSFKWYLGFMKNAQIKW